MTPTNKGESYRLTCEKLDCLGFKRKKYSKNTDMYVYDDGMLEKVVLKKPIDAVQWSGTFEGADADMHMRKLTVSGGLEFEDDLFRCMQTVGIAIAN